MHYIIIIELSLRFSASVLMILIVKVAYSFPIQPIGALLVITN